MKKECAIEIQKLALEAVRNLAQITNVDAGSYEEYSKIKRGAGLSIGAIQMEILEVINRIFPELDDLKDK